MTEEISGGILRDFIYLDRERMYSLYSQLFKGIVESMVRTLFSESAMSRESRKLEETVIDASVKNENVVLYDHIYNTLETALNPYLLTIDGSKRVSAIKPNSFVKIKGTANIADYAHLLHFIDNYNDIGLAVSGLSMGNNQDSETNSSSARKKNQSRNSIEKYAKNNNLYFDKKLLDNLSTILKEFHGDMLEIAFHTENSPVGVRFRSLLEDKYLRMPRNSLRVLYGYEPSMELTLVGEVTDTPSLSESDYLPNLQSFDGMIDLIGQLEKKFSEFVTAGTIIKVAPIAVYIEHTLNSIIQ